MNSVIMKLQSNAIPVILFVFGWILVYEGSPNIKTLW